MKAVHGVPIEGLLGARARNRAVALVYPEIEEREYCFVDPIRLYGGKW